MTDRPIALPRGPRAPAPFDVDKGLVAIFGDLEGEDLPLHAGREIRPPSVPMGEVASGEALIGPGSVERKLPRTISDVAVGGGGRYLLLTVQGGRKLAIFDANAADVVKMIPLAYPGSFVAAGAEKFVIVFPTEKVIQRWDFKTLEREPGGSAPLPIEGELKGLAMGSDSAGPILAMWIPRGNEPVFSFISLDTMKVLRMKSDAAGAGTEGPRVTASGGSIALGGYPVVHGAAQVRASAGGGLFAIWNTNQYPSGIGTLRVAGGSVSGFYAHESADAMLPGPDGRTIYTEIMGRLDAEGRRIGREADATDGTSIYLPTCDPAYYLKIACLPRKRQNGEPAASRERGPGSVWSAEVGERLVTFSGIEEILPSSPPLASPMPSSSMSGPLFPERMHLIPAAKLLVTIPRSDDRLVLRRLDIEQTSGDGPVVTSPTTVNATPGRTLEHQIVARSSRGKVRFELADGPDGLPVAPDGKLTFAVPATLAGGQVSAVILITDEAGRERFHKLTILAR